MCSIIWNKVSLYKILCACGSSVNGFRKFGGNRLSSPGLVRQERIRNGKLKPRDPLPSKRDLAEQFGASRTAVRETLQALRDAFRASFS
ncbi:FadR/GntR family transcriptional regulator [Thermoflexus sp.]|uniref:FadR/GntR family transcriptional regulator n=1 Tax=Thermoflexus sp. TaxID=1969742 RepID=UPI00176F2D6B